MKSVDASDPLEIFWDNLLSRQPEKVRSAYETLDPNVKPTVLAHLKRMITEPGWHPEQRQSAEAALRALGELPNL
jgi:hypothetical protein